MNLGFVLMMPPAVEAAMLADLRRLCTFTQTFDDEGACLISIVDVPNGAAPTFDDNMMLSYANDLHYKVLSRLPGLLPPAPRLDRDPAQHMAQLRKRTGQDWRGRR